MSDPDDISEVEELLYEIVAAEVAAGELRSGLMAKAVAETGGNDAAAHALYLKFRVKQLVRELAAQAAAAVKVVNPVLSQTQMRRKVSRLLLF